MKIKIVKELEKYSYNQIIDLIELRQDDVDKKIDILLKNKILKKTKEDDKKNKITNYFDLYSDAEEYQYRYSFDYVGIVMLDNICFFIYPKYIKEPKLDSDNGYLKFKQILKVIRKYKFKEEHVNYGDNQLIDFNQLSFTLDIIEDYYENGLYNNEKMMIEENGFGEIFWEKTINEQTVYISDNTPIYLDFYTINNDFNQENIFHRLHKAIITECCEVVEEILKIIGIEPIILSEERVEDFGDTEHIKSLLKQELTNQFVTSREKMLYNMINYIEKKTTNKGNEKISFVGTSSFNLVWQDVCSCIKNNCLNKTLLELKLNPPSPKVEDEESKEKKSNLKSLKLKEIISKPKWKTIDNKTNHKRKTFELDIISIKKKELLIYDAKYYRMELDDKHLINNPGVEDVAKQYFYRLAYKKLAKENNLKIRNIFLFPCDSAEVDEKQIGSVSIDLFFEEKLDDIEVVLVPCDEVYKRYLSM